MTFFKKLFKKDQPAQIFLTSFQTSLPVYGSHSHKIANYQDHINQWLERDFPQLCQASLEQALDFLTYTGEAFFCFFDPEDDPDYAADLLESWSDPGMTHLVDCLERWFSPKEASAVAQKARQLVPEQPKHFDQLSLALAQAVLELGLTRDNFGHAYPALKDELKNQPLGILRFLRPQSLTLTERDGNVLAELDLDCDWETEHGCQWQLTRQASQALPNN